MATWWIELRRPEHDPARINLEGDGPDARKSTHQIDGLTVSVCVEEAHGRIDVVAEVTGIEEASCYLALCASAPGATLQNFYGEMEAEEVVRQSPHDPDQHWINLAIQPVPLAGILEEATPVFLVADTPAHAENFTTQEFVPAKGRVALCTGDSGSRPGHQGLPVQAFFHSVGPGTFHRLDAIVVRPGTLDLAAVRLTLYEAITRRWGPAGAGLFTALCWGTNYMHLRRNETGYSKVWIVPGIEYCNKQYTRDAFWQSMILSPELDQECYNAVYPARYRYAENSALYLLWAMRIAQAGGTVDRERVADALDFLETHALDAAFHPPSAKEGQKDFRSWYDLVAFEDDDCISYNQGLFAAGLRAAATLGLSPQTKWTDAAAVYRGLFNEQDGFYPLSRRKQVLCVDALAGDLMAQVLFGESLLPAESVHRHFARLRRCAWTDYGFKVTCGKDGAYLPGEAYGAAGQLEQAFRDPANAGSYQWGGSWCLYDMLCILDAVAQGAEGAVETAIERMRIEFRLGGTYHEHIHTRTGEPCKPGQGWNACVPALWRQLVETGRADNRFFSEIDQTLQQVRAR